LAFNGRYLRRVLKRVQRAVDGQILAFD